VNRRLFVLAVVTTLVILGSAANARGASRCDWLRPHLQWVGLPVSTFTAIASRESGCARDGVRVSDGDDLSTSRFGLNFRGAAMQGHWYRLCSATWTQPGAVLEIDLLCTKAAYDRLGLAPWR
jgi:hypothetical protein